ncbi:MAG: hypothetical protein HUN04_13025 [Desulfobacter sp.]|nr:MAG: hypothetical protein HUN04_13025 [Desulfobacter sp.]
MKALYFIILLVPVLAGSAFCDPLSITPYVGIKQEYSDNILFSSNNEKSDAVTVLRSGLEVKQDEERLDARINAEANQFLYWEFDGLNALDYRVDGSASYRVTERLGTRASARYAKDSRRDADADTTGLILSGDRKSYSLSAGSDYMLSELDQADISLSFRHSDIEEINSDEDNDTIGVDFSYTRNLSRWLENTSGVFNLSYMHYAAESEAWASSVFANVDQVTYREYLSDIAQFSTGLSYNVTELYNLFCFVGASYTSTTEKPGSRLVHRSTGTVLSDSPGTQSENDTIGGVLSTGVNYDGLYYDMNLTLSQDVRGGSGTSGAVQRTSLSGRINRKVTDEFSLSLNASCYRNQNERRTAADTDELTFNIQPGFRYRLARDFFLSGIYRFTSVEDRETDTVSERSLVYLQLKKEFELH